MQSSPIVTWQDILPYLITHAETIPATSWVGALTFLGALIVVWRTNVQNTKRLEMQLIAEEARLQTRLSYEAQAAQRNLDHDRERMSRQLEHDTEQRSTERLVSLRRDIYLEAIAEFETFRRVLLKLPESGVVLDALNAVNAALSRVVVVCAVETRAMASQAMVAYATAAQDALKLTRPYIEKRGEEDLANKKQDRLYARQASLFEAQKALLDAPKPGELLSTAQNVVLESIKGQLSQVTTSIDTGHTALLAIGAARGAMVVELIEKIAEVIAPAAKASEFLLGRLRIELGIDIPRVDTPT